MKILQITSTFFPVMGGQEKVIYEISKRMKKERHEVTILTTDLLCKTKVLEKESLNGIKIIRLKNKFYLGGYGYSPQAIDWLKKNWQNYDIIHSHGYNRHLSEYAVHYLKNKVPIVFTPDGFIHTKKNYLIKKIHDLTYGRVIGKADFCTAMTKLDFTDYKKLGVKKEKIIEVPCGVDIKKFKKISLKEISEFKKKFHLTKNILLYVGRIYESKGLAHVVKAIKDIDCTFVIAGPDAGYKKELKKIIKKNKVQEKVVFTGPLSDKDLMLAYHSSDIFILFSDWEGFGVTVIEAMAAGKPVIVSDRGSLPFIVRDGENGLIVPYRDIRKLKNRIEFLLKNKKEANTIAKNNQKTALKYEWGDVVKKYLEIYKKAIRKYKSYHA